MTATSFIKNYQTRVEQHLDHLLSSDCKTTANIVAPKLVAAMRYSLLNGGKRIRALLVYASGLHFDAPLDVLDNIAAAIECIHSFSLIHDDLPAMDNSDLRRGHPSCHKQFNEAIAILAGDALQSIAFEILASIKSPALSTAKCLKMTKVLAQAIGAAGMAGGQALDMQSLSTLPTEQQLQQLHHCKTGTLITAAITLGVLAAPQCNNNSMMALEEFGNHLGLAYQVQDDILDHSSTTQQLGKQAQQDIANNKHSFVTVLGLTAAQQCCHHYYSLATQALDHAKLSNPSTQHLKCLLNWLKNRSY